MGAYSIRFILAGLAAIAMGQANAATMVSQTGTVQSTAGSVGQAVGFHLAGTWQNVAIEAQLATAVGRPVDGTMYLMTQIGPGTTTANQIAQITIHGLDHAGRMVSLITGLTLGPGDYFLVLDNRATDTFGTIGFQSLNFPVVTLSVGVTFLKEQETNADDAFIPSAPYSNVAGPNTHYGFSVTGDPVNAPEPSTILFTGIGLAIIVLGRRSLTARRLRRDLSSTSD